MNGTHRDRAVAPHPESYCHRCGGVNASWFAPSDVWNEVMGSPDGIVCPNCFVLLARMRGIDPTWMIAPRDQRELVDIRTTHPYGFRSGQWARLIGVEWVGYRPCYSVRFSDGVTDQWVMADPHYEFRAAGGGPR